MFCVFHLNFITRVTNKKFYFKKVMVACYFLRALVSQLRVFSGFLKNFLNLVGSHKKLSMDKIDWTRTGQIESDPQDSLWSTPKEQPEYHSAPSNTLQRSKKIPKVVLFLSIAEDILLIKSIKAKCSRKIITEPKLRWVYLILFKFKKLISRFYMTFSKSLEKTGRIDIGL